MPDVFSSAKRSEVMSRIRGRGNKETELALMKLLRKAGIRGWRRHVRVRTADIRKPFATVTPDFVFQKVRLAMFVDGCFWHGCPKHSNPMKWIAKSSMLVSIPSGGRRTGRVFWRRKLEANKRRDRIVNLALHHQGWRVLRIWEHDLAKNRNRYINKIRIALGAKYKS